MLKLLLLLLLLFLILINLTLLINAQDSSSHSSSSSPKSNYLYITIINQNYVKQQYIIYDVWNNVTILNETLKIDQDIYEILSVNESNDLLVFSDGNLPKLLSINSKTLNYSTVDTITQPADYSYGYFYQSLFYIKEMNILYKPVILVDQSIGALLELNFNSGISYIINVTVPEYPGEFSAPAQTYNEIDDMVYVVYNSSNRNILVNFKQSDTSKINLIGEINNLNDLVTLIFTDNLNNIYIVSETQEHIINVCQMDLKLMNCNNVISNIDLSNIPYSFQPYFISRDKNSLVFITYYQERENSMLLQVFDIYNNFKQSKTLFYIDNFENPFNVNSITVTY